VDDSPVARLRRRMVDGEMVTAVLITMPAVGGVQIWANAGVDVLAFDLEHGHIDPTTLHALIAATAGTDVVPTVRVAANEPWPTHVLQINAAAEQGGDLQVG
jgi:4-hydroxy-2-oxoheptanedioate aldolase